MSRDGRIPDDWYVDDAVAKRGRAARGPALSWGGLALAAATVVGLAWLAGGTGGGTGPEPTRVRFRRTPSPLGSVAFAPDGKALALGRSDGRLEIRALAGGQPVEIEADVAPGGSARGLAYSPDGRTLASAGPGPGVRLWDAASGAPRGSIEVHSAPICSLAFSPDGRLLASGSRDGSVEIREVETGREPAPLGGHAGDVRGLAFSPDGRALASGSFDGSVKLRDVASGRELAGYRDDRRRVYSLAFAPDGKTLALGLGSAADGAGGRVVLWDLAGDRRSARVLGLASFPVVAYSPDGKTLVAGGGDRVVKRWDVGSGRELASLAGHEGYITSLAFSPDGQLLVTGGEDALIGLFELRPDGLKPPRYRL